MLLLLDKRVVSAVAEVRLQSFDNCRALIDQLPHNPPACWSAGSCRFAQLPCPPRPYLHRCTCVCTCIGTCVCLAYWSTSSLLPRIRWCDTRTAAEQNKKAFCNNCRRNAHVGVISVLRQCSAMSSCQLASWVATCIAVHLCFTALLCCAQLSAGQLGRNLFCCVCQEADRCSNCCGRRCTAGLCKVLLACTAGTFTFFYHNSCTLHRFRCFLPTYPLIAGGANAHRVKGDGEPCKYFMKVALAIA